MIDDVTFDDTSLRRVSPEGGVEEIAWDDLVEVRVVTTADAPLGDDVSWQLESSDGTELVVQASSMSDALLDRLRRLPGFDESRHVCWQARP